jgi:hypothetical protein
MPPVDKTAPIKKAIERKMKEGREAKGTRPPNLRAAEGNKRCGNCRHFRENGNRCRLYGEYRVSADQVSDSWEPTNK